METLKKKVYELEKMIRDVTHLRSSEELYLTLLCPNCNDQVQSHSTHDHVYCSCGSISADGGRTLTGACTVQNLTPQQIAQLFATRRWMPRQYRENDPLEIRIDRFDDE